jgi:hypothetical protein
MGSVQGIPEIDASAEQAIIMKGVVVLLERDTLAAANSAMPRIPLVIRPITENIMEQNTTGTPR